eukprot:3567112-Prymnesium_polylepis.2
MTRRKSSERKMKTTKASYWENEDMEAEEGADKFDEDDYKSAMAALRKGRMLQDDLKEMEHD